jgi:3-methyladenine DNA glycosylase AlkC
MIEKRKGSRSIATIPKSILEQLNHGAIESANLVEWLAIDQQKLLKNLLEEENRIFYLKSILNEIDQLKKQTVNTINETIGIGLLHQASINNDDSFLSNLSKHTSDTIRCWSAYTIGFDKSISLKKVLKKIEPFACDSHFGVREIAWLAVRKRVSENLTESIEILSQWSEHKHFAMRRFASEVTRPRGVWCAHIEELKLMPQLALPILEPLKSDPEKYVQDSVGNWLNDASKTQPNFVTDICKKWQKVSKTKETLYIIKKALRTLEK